MKGSIRLSLLRLLIGPLIVVQLLGGGITYWLAWGPAETAFDQSLADAAWALIPRLREATGNVRMDLPGEVEQVLRVDHFDSIFFTVRSPDGKLIGGDSDFPALRPSENVSEPAAYDDIMRGQEVRVIALKTLIGQEPVVIAVAETLAKRHQLRRATLLYLILLEGLFTLTAVAVVWVAVGKGLHPLRILQSQLGGRERDDLSPVSEDTVAVELRPLVGALNGVLASTQSAVHERQEFLANVAHQLRTPLAGLKIQVEWLQQRYAGEPETSRSAELMMSSTQRLIRQTNQFLALARAEPTQFRRKFLDQVALDQLVVESIRHFVEEADKHDIDLGFDLNPITVAGDAFLLRDLIDNLIDNAIRYSHKGGSVTVRCLLEDNRPTLSVEDSGPGISVAERDLIFNRFYRGDHRVPGSGLGLAIVQDIVKDHGAEIILTSGVTGSGSVFSVRFPQPLPPAVVMPRV